MSHTVATRIAASIATAAAAVALAAPSAQAADYDSRGILVTPSRASMTAGVRCSTTSLKIVLQTGATPPTHYRANIYTQATGTWSGWTRWYTAPRGYTQAGMNLARGNYQMVVQIAHWNGAAWYYDAEYTSVSNDHPLYSNSPWCHVGY